MPDHSVLLTPYLLFNGNCREAMLFYQTCLGGELTFQTVKDVNDVYEWPDTLSRVIIQATLIKDSFMLKASDLSYDNTLVKGNTVTFMLSCASQEEVKRVMTKLLIGGVLIQELNRTSDNDLLASLIDKYGHYWTIFSKADGY